MGKLDATTCSWCGSRRRSFDSWRDHIALDECGRIPVADQAQHIVQWADTFSERTFERAVVRWFRAQGWRGFHAERMRGRDGDWMTNTTSSGLPDWVFIRPPHCLFIELKKQTGKPSKDQVHVIRDLQACTRVGGWFARPSDAVTLLDLAVRSV